MWGLDTPNYFYLFLLIPVLIAVYLWNTSWKKRKIAEFGSGNYLRKLAPEASTTSKPLIKIALLTATVALLIFALVNPKFGTKIETVKRQGVDIVFAIDVSKSMLAEDIAPSRLGKTKQLATQIINNWNCRLCRFGISHVTDYDRLQHGENVFARYAHRHGFIDGNGVA